MPEFKVVISDPKGGKSIVKVKVRGTEEVKLTAEEKERRRLPVARVSPALLKRLGADTKVLTLRMKNEKGERVNITVKAITDDDIPENEVRISAELLGEKVGVDETEAEVFRAKAWQLTLDEVRSSKLVGLRYGEEFDGSLVDLPGFRLKITGGSDSSGFPMRPDLPGPAKKKVLLSEGPGFNPRERGERRRKMVRGNVITEDFVQINTKIVY